MTFKYKDIATTEKETFKFKDVVSEVEPVRENIDPDIELKEIGDIVDISDDTGVDLFTTNEIYPPLSYIIKAIPDPKDVTIKSEEIETKEQKLVAAEPEKEGILQTFLGFKYPPKPPDWKYASLIERFNYITLPISDFLGRIGGKIATDWRLTTKEKVQTTLAHELADDLKWYQKTPEAIGWTSEKVAEFLLLKGIFKVSGLHKVLTVAGQKAATPFLAKEITARGGIKAISTLSSTGIKDLSRKALTSFLTAAPENAAFIGSWSGLDAAIKGESPQGIADEVVRGAGWGLALTAGLSVIAPIAQAPELRMAFGKAMANVGQRYPKLIDRLGKPIAKDIEKEWLKALSKSRGKDVRLIDLSTRERAIFRNAVRAAEGEILKAAEKEAAIQAYWAAKAVKPPPPPPEPIKPTKPTTVQQVVDQAETKMAKIGDLALDNKGIEEVIKAAEAIIPAPEPTPKPITPEKAVEVAPTDKEGVELEDLEGTPIPINKNGTITLFHRTSAENAKKIKTTGEFVSEEREKVFFSSKEKGQAEGFGEEIIQIKIDPSKVSLDDAFRDGEIHVLINNKDISLENIITPVAKAEPTISKLKERAVERIKERGYELNQMVQVDEKTKGKIVGARSTGAEVAILDEAGKTLGYAADVSWAKLDKLNKPPVAKVEPKGIAITPRFGAIRDMYNRAHDWMFTFGQAKREAPELYDELMSAYGKRNAGVEKAIDQIDAIMPKEIKLNDDVLLAKTYEDKRLTPPENLKEIYDRFARLLDEMSKKQLEEGLFAKPFNERMIEENNIRIEKFVEELQHPEKSKQIKRLREENATLEQMRYLSHSVVAKRTIESKLNTLTGDKRKAYLTRLSAFYKKRTGKLFLKDYLKAKLITKEDMRMSRLATEEISDYYVRSAYKGLYDYAKSEGYIKPISEELRAEGWLNQKELGISSPELKDKLVHPILGSALAEMKAMRKGRGSFISQLFGMVKQGQFIKPTIIYTYNTVQKYMRGMYSLNPITEAKALVKATRTVLNKDELYHKLNESNLYQFPYEITKAGRDEEIAKFINQHAAEVDKLTKMLEKTFDTRWLDPDMTVGQLVRNVIMAAHRAVARLTWSGDKIQRTQSYLILRKMGYPHDEAVKVASKSHGGYSLISEKLKKAASTKLFVYTFRIMMPIEMGKTITEPLIAAKDAMGGARIPKHKWERMVKAIIGTAFLPFAIDQYMNWRGFKKEGIHLGPLAWKWRKEMEVEGKTREIVVGLNYILNMPIKYWQRLTYYNPISKSTRGLQIINNISKWEIHPVYRIFFWDIRENRRSFGSGVTVYDAEANTAIQFGQIAKYIFGQSFRFFGGMMDAIGEGSMTEKERQDQEKIFDAGLTDLDKLLFTVLGYKYTRQPIEERRAIMYKYLEKELVSRIFETARKYEGKELEKRKDGLERWARKCEEWIENKMR